MIVPAMSTEEVRLELLHDLESVKRMMISRFKPIYQEVKRKHEEHQVRSVTYLSVRKNRWTLLYRFHGAQIGNTFYTDAVDKRGKVAFQFSKSNHQFDTGIIKYNPHFFRRYRERVNPHITNPSDVIKHFFKHNFQCNAGETETLPDETRLINYVFDEGIGIGWHTPAKKIVHMKTFLPHHMLNKTQQSWVDYIRHHDDGEEFRIKVREENQQRKL
jgi:hypothetical protein